MSRHFTTYVSRPLFTFVGLDIVVPYSGRTVYSTGNVIHGNPVLIVYLRKRDLLVEPLVHLHEDKM